MLYQITGRQINIGAALQTHVKSVVDVIAKKYAERPTDAVIVFFSQFKRICLRSKRPPLDRPHSPGEGAQP